MRTIKLSLLGLAIALIAGLGLAQSAQAITLIPPSLEFNVKPGDPPIQTKVKLFNETAEPVQMYAATALFTAKDESGVPAFITDQPVEGLASWIKIAAGPFPLQPGERVEIPVEITVPANADPGGHFAGILFSPQAPADDAQVAITSKVGTLILVRVAGEVRESATVASFGTETGKTQYNRLPIELAARIQNSGNVHIRPNGNITIRNMLGGTTVVLPVNSVQGAVLPASVRKFTAVWEKTALTGKSNFFSEFGREWKNFALGPYTATLSLTYGQNNDKTLNSSYQFFVFPWRVLLLSVIIIILAIWLIMFSVKRYNRWVIAKAAQQSHPKK
ncbi:MAG: hypothetical protein HY976_04185 [Candidatus Kerfeldbacteria bacterium]|nr:hypothetical protein [Candidatus Kerfeldbacteria bacterium]